MRHAHVPAVLALALLVPLSNPATARAADERDPLARARRLYNDAKYDEAITAADQARTAPGRADSADLVAARARLERFRASAAQTDLTNARERLRRLDPRRFIGPERDELMVGLGETLFFDADYGAAAAIFTSILARPDAVPDARERVLDWWATALDREARPRSDIDRQPIYQRIRDRMQQELAARPASTAAAYWLSAAAQGQGDVPAAWAAAQAAWLRAPLAADSGVALRADLDQLVVKSLVSARAKALAEPPDMVRQEWERFKERWAK